MEFINLKEQYKLLKDKVDARVHDVLNHGRYIMGPEVKELEEKLSEFIGVKHSISCANGTDALVLALMALNVGPGDYVFCPTFTFFASAESIVSVGATPIFVDVHPETFNICINDLRNKITEAKNSGQNIKSIMTVDLFGLPANYAEIATLAKENSLTIIEDAAQGLGGAINEKRAGSFADIATSSFFPAKPLGCYGDGGVVFTDSDEYAERLRSLRVHGKGQDKYDNVRIGMNSRLDTLQAAILLEKLNIFDEEIKMRNAVAKKYNEFLDGVVKTPFIPEGYLSSWAQYTILVEKRDSLQEYLSQKNIPSMIYYKTPMHKQTALLEFSNGDLKNSDELSTKVLSLPMSPYTTDEEIKEVCDAIKSFYTKQNSITKG